MGGLIAVIVILFIMFSMIGRMQKSVNNMQHIKASGVNKELRGGTAGSTQVVNQRSKTTLAALSASMENRGNDWLARQLAEERAVKKRMSDMFDMRQEHQASCEAASVRQMHQENCDAHNVDNARA